MRLLVLYQAKDPAHDQPGYYQGFERLVQEGILEAHASIGFLGVAETMGWDGFWAEAYRAASELHADSVFLQFFHSHMPDPSAGISRITNLPNRPVVFSSLGDPFGRWTNRVPHSFRIASALSDVSFLTGMGYIANQMASGGASNLVLMPNGCCQVRFSAPPQSDLSAPEFDVVFVGSKMRPLSPTSHFYWTARQRVRLVDAFTKRYGRRFALFGKGWEGNPSWHGHIPYAQQHACHRRAAVILGGMPGAYYDYYTSDRVFIAAASGVPLVDYWVRGVDRLLEPGRDWWLARDLNEMFHHCDQLLEMPSHDRLALAAQTRERILAHHTQYHRCLEMIEIVTMLRDARRSGRTAPPPELKFLQNPSHAGAAPPAIVAWRG